MVCNIYISNNIRIIKYNINIIWGLIHNNNNTITDLKNNFIVLSHPELRYQNILLAEVCWMESNTNLYNLSIDRRVVVSLSPTESEKLKCYKCPREFRSTISYHRHLLVHSPNLKLDKESDKKIRGLLQAFWDKLSVEDAVKICSFDDVSLEGVSGPSIVKALTLYVQQPGNTSIGRLLLEFVQGKAGRFPISSCGLFSVLDGASEKTFLCSGTAETLQKFVFDGDAGKIGLQMRNLIACTSFLIEQKLVKAYIADKDAGALRHQKLFEEKEIAAPKRVNPVDQETVISSSSDILYQQCGTDKISKLPDDILLDVLLILDLTHAAQTSVLAKRWRYLWTWRTDLNLHPANTNFKDKRLLLVPTNGPHVYLNWVNQVVDAHRGPCITKCRVYFRHPKPSLHYQSHIEKWTRFALSKRVTDLQLNLFSSPKSTSFSLGFDILKHPLYYNGIVNLKSLRLTSVDISGEALEFILLHCRLLEVLYVSCSKTLHTVNIVSDRLKHLTLSTCVSLKELRIDAVNLISFHHSNFYLDAGVFYITHMVFNHLPNLVDMSFEGQICRYPFPILGQLSCLFSQLTRLAFHPIVVVGPFLNDKFSDICPEYDVVFPYAKQLTLSVAYLNSAAIIFIKFFINACPVLHELKLQVVVNLPLMLEAKQLKEVELENEISDDMSKEGNPYSQAQEEKVIKYVVGEDNGSSKWCPNLKALEFVGFRGYDCDVELILDVIAGAKFLHTLIFDPRCPRAIGEYWEKEPDVAKTDEIRRRVRKLSKLVPRGVRVGIRDMNGLLLVSQN